MTDPCLLQGRLLLRPAAGPHVNSSCWALMSASCVIGGSFVTKYVWEKCCLFPHSFQCLTTTTACTVARKIQSVPKESREESRDLFHFTFTWYWIILTWSISTLKVLLLHRGTLVFNTASKESIKVHPVASRRGNGVFLVPFDCPYPPVSKRSIDSSKRRWRYGLPSFLQLSENQSAVKQL